MNYCVCIHMSGNIVRVCWWSSLMCPCSVVPRGANNVYSMPVDVTLWGRPDTKAEALRIVRQSGYIVYEGLSQVPAQSAAMSYSNSSLLNVPARRTFLSPTEVIL